MNKCEAVRARDNSPCPAQASFLVGVGTRKSDRQWSCARHLAQTVIAFEGAEGRNGVQVTVAWRPGGLEPEREVRT